LLLLGLWDVASQATMLIAAKLPLAMHNDILAGIMLRYL
jgi:hypothetical protein